MNNQTIRLYKNSADANRAYKQLIKRHKFVSNIFKHYLSDKRFKNKLRYGIVIS